MPRKIRVENFEWKVLAQRQRPNARVPDGAVGPQLLRGNPSMLLYIGFICGRSVARDESTSQCPEQGLRVDHA